jgi:hypothetical protein
LRTFWPYWSWLTDVATSDDLNRRISDNHQAKIYYWIDLHERLGANALDLNDEVRDG